MTKLTQILFLLTLCVTQSAFGAAKVIKQLPNELIVESSAKYLLGDNDTRIDARNIVLNEAKRVASELAGTQVKSDLVIENDQILKDQITIVAASFMTVEVLKEAMTTSQDGRSVMEITIRAHLDKSAIRSKLEAYRGDAKRQKELSSIQAENSRLQSELESLNAELSKIRNAANDGSASQKPRAELVARRDVVISSIEESQGQVRRVFEKGSLLNMAKKSNDDYKESVRIINDEIFGYIKNNTKITLTEPEFRDNRNGTYDVFVGASWQIEKEPVIEKLAQFFNFEVYGNQLRIFEFNNVDGKQKLSYSNKLYKNLNKKIAIQIKLSNKKAKLTIAWKYRDNFDTQYFDLAFSGSGHDKFKDAQSEQNPLVIRNIPAAVLQNSKSITAEIVVE
jgi:hypothetical protein